MFSHALCVVFTLLMFIEADCRLFSRSHRIYRRNQEMFQTSLPITNPFRTASSQITFPFATNLYSEQTGFQPGSASLQIGSASAGSAGLSPGNSRLTLERAGLSPENVRLPLESEELPPPNVRLSPGYVGLASGKVGLLSENEFPHRNEQLLPVNERLQPINERLQPINERLQPINEKLQPINEGLPFGNDKLVNGGIPHGNSGVTFRSEGLQQGSIEMPPGNAESPPDMVEFPLESVELSPENVELPYGGEKSSFRNVGFAKRDSIGFEENTRMASQNDWILPDTTFDSSFFSSSLAAILPTTSYPDLNFNPNKSNLKRRKKNAPEKNDKVKYISDNEKTLEDATLSNFLNENDNVKNVIDYLEDDIVDNNATVIPLPKGLQIKTLSKQNNGRVNATVNITSNTQKLLSSDNVTEVEKMVEMQMEKEIKDDNGSNTGSEELRIVETERIKPIVYKKGVVSSLRKRRTKSYKKRYVGHHRSKRSKMDSAEIPNSVFHKMARSFLSKVGRKERVVERNNLMNRQIIPTFNKNGRRNKARGVEHVRDDLIYSKGELVDFVKFFLKEMQKFREYQENNKNSTVSLNVINTGEREDNLKFSAHKVKKFNINFEYPENTNVLMSLNMTQDKKINGYSNGTRKIRENFRNIVNVLERTTSAIHSVNISATPQTVIYVDDRKDSVKLTAIIIILLSAVGIFSLVLATWICRDKLCSLSSRMGNYKRFYEEGQGDGVRGPKYSAIKDKFSDIYQQLEWQSEDGDWLSEKEKSQVNF